MPHTALIVLARDRSGGVDPLRLKDIMNVVYVAFGERRIRAGGRSDCQTGWMNPDGQARALSSLRGLAVGDAFGACFDDAINHGALRSRTLLPGPWLWTDDTQAMSAPTPLARHRHAEPIGDERRRRRWASTHHTVIRSWVCARSRCVSSWNRESR